MSYEDALARLKDERQRMSLSQQQMSQYIHISQSHYSKVEHGNRRLTYYELKCMCERDVDIHYIFTGQRCGDRYRNDLLSLGYSELIGCLGIVSATFMYLSANGPTERRRFACKKVEFLKCIEIGRRTNANIFYGLRLLLDCAQQKMAEILGVDVKKLRDLENDRTLPDSEIVCRLYDLYGIPPAAVLEDGKGLVSEICCLLEMVDARMGDFTFQFLLECHDFIS